jgi:hypothetical protein
MAFRVRLDEEAAKKLMSLPPQIRLHVALEIQRLGESPAAVSEPAAFPHPLDGQFFRFKYAGPAEDHFFTVMFRYSADETAIDVAWIVHQQRPQSESYEDGGSGGGI